MLNHHRLLHWPIFILSIPISTLAFSESPARIYDAFLYEAPSAANAGKTELAIVRIKGGQCDRSTLPRPDDLYLSPNDFVISGGLWYTDGGDYGLRVLNRVDLASSGVSTHVTGLETGVRVEDQFLYCTHANGSPEVRAFHCRTRNDRLIAKLNNDDLPFVVAFEPSRTGNKVAILSGEDNTSGQLILIVNVSNGAVDRVKVNTPLGMAGVPYAAAPIAWYDEYYLVALRRDETGPEPRVVIVQINLRDSAVTEIAAPQEVQAPQKDAYRIPEIVLGLFPGKGPSTIAIDRWIGRRERITLAADTFTLDVPNKKLLREAALGGPYRTVKVEVPEESKKFLLRYPTALKCGDADIGYDPGLSYLPMYCEASPDGKRVVWYQCGPSMDEYKNRPKDKPIDEGELRKNPRVFFHEASTNKPATVVDKDAFGPFIWIASAEL